MELFPFGEGLAVEFGRLSGIGVPVAVAVHVELCRRPRAGKEHRRVAIHYVVGEPERLMLFRTGKLQLIRNAIGEDIVGDYVFLAVVLVAPPKQKLNR